MKVSFFSQRLKPEPQAMRFGLTTARSWERFKRVTGWKEPPEQQRDQIISAAALSNAPGEHNQRREQLEEALLDFRASEGIKRLSRMLPMQLKDRATNTHYIHDDAFMIIDPYYDEHREHRFTVLKPDPFRITMSAAEHAQDPVVGMRGWVKHGREIEKQLGHLLEITQRPEVDAYLHPRLTMLARATRPLIKGKGYRLCIRDFDRPNYEDRFFRSLVLYWGDWGDQTQDENGDDYDPWSPSPLTRKSDSRTEAEGREGREKMSIWQSLSGLCDLRKDG